MKIAVFGATGNIGSQIVAEALRRGHEVTGVARRPGAASDVTWRQADAGDPATVADIAGGHDVVVSAIGPSRVPGESGQPFLDAVENFVNNVGTTRLVVVGGASSLMVAPGLRLIDSPQFPAELKAEAGWGIRSLEALQAAPQSLSWTYLSPPPQIGPGERTGRYVVGADEVVGSSISYADYAVALVDEMDTPQHLRTRFTVAN